MYLVSIYFDDKTEDRIQNYINKVAINSMNNYMIDANVPPHITISAFEADDEEIVIDLLDKKIKSLQSGILQWVSIGVFNPNVIFLTPVLNEYLHNLSLSIYEGLKEVEGINISKYYLPLQWLPHTTIAKKLSQSQLLNAFETLQKSFSMFSGEVTRISLTKTNPYTEIKFWKI